MGACRALGEAGLMGAGSFRFGGNGRTRQERPTGGRLIVVFPVPGNCRGVVYCLTLRVPARRGYGWIVLGDGFLA